MVQKQTKNSVKMCKKRAKTCKKRAMCLNGFKNIKALLFFS